MADRSRNASWPRLARSSVQIVPAVALPPPRARRDRRSPRRATPSLSPTPRKRHEHELVWRDHGTRPPSTPRRGVGNASRTSRRAKQWTTFSLVSVRAQARSPSSRPDRRTEPRRSRRRRPPAVTRSGKGPPTPAPEPGERDSVAEHRRETGWRSGGPTCSPSAARGVPSAGVALPSKRTSDELLRRGGGSRMRSSARLPTKSVSRVSPSP